MRYLEHRALRSLHGPAANDYDYLGSPAQRASQLARLRLQLQGPSAADRNAIPTFPLPPPGPWPTTCSSACCGRGTTRMSTSTNDDLSSLRRDLARRHHCIGWAALLLFLSLGAVLEFLHGFKVGFYLDPGQRLRRELWTLAHAHGTLLALIQIGFAAGVMQFGSWTAGRLKLVSFFLLDAALLIPLGFFLGGLLRARAIPGWASCLSRSGALLLFVAVALIVISNWHQPDQTEPPP